MNAQQAWQATLGQLQMEMSKAAYDTWVRSTELVSHDQNTFVVGVQNAYARDWLESRLSNAVTQHLTDIMTVPQEVKFVLAQHEIEQAEAARTADMAALPTSAEDNRPSNPTINLRYTFDNFVVGASNRLAHAACMAVAENPAQAYNPLFLYGGVGLGKTHLLHAIGNAAHQHGLAGAVRLLRRVYQRPDQFDPHPQHRPPSASATAASMCC